MCGPTGRLCATAPLPAGHKFLGWCAMGHLPGHHVDHVAGLLLPGHHGILDTACLCHSPELVLTSLSCVRADVGFLL